MEASRFHRINVISGLAKDGLASIQRNATGAINTPCLNIGGLPIDGMKVQAKWSVPTPILGETSVIFANRGALPTSIPPRARSILDSRSTMSRSLSYRVPNR